MSSLRDAIRSALRGVVARPLFSALVILTLAVGIGANTAIFTVADATLRRGLPYPDADRLMTIDETRTKDDYKELEFAYPTFVDVRAQQHSFEAFGGFTNFMTTLSGRGPNELLPVGFVTGEFFRLLGVRAALGRTLEPGDEAPEAAAVVVLSHAMWTERFGGDAEVIGKTLTLDGETAQVVGVLERGFAFAPTGNAGLWRPARPKGGMRARRNLHWMHGIGRLAPGVSVEQARAELAAITGRIATAYPDSNAGGGARVAPLSEQVLGKARPIVLLLLGAVGLLLLIACANVANLLLARHTSRQKELAVRSALGASSGALVVLLTAEALLYALIAGALGIVLALWGVDLLVGAIPPAVRGGMPFLAGARVDVLALLVTFAIATLTGLTVGVTTALRAARPDLADALKDEGRSTGGPRRGRLRDALVVAEVALAFTLLAGAGLVGRSLLAVLATDPGFDARELVTAQITLPRSYESVEQVNAVRAELERSIGALPGAREVAMVDLLPLGRGGNTIRFVLEGRPQPPNTLEPEANIREVTANYFAAMRVPVLAGRSFDGLERADGEPVVIVNRTLAARWFGGSPDDAVGKSIRYTFSKDQPPRRIIAVVGDEHMGPLDQQANPAVYEAISTDNPRFLSLLVRGRAGAEELRRAIHGVDGTIAIAGIATMEELIARAPWMFVRTFPALLVGAFALLALFLTAIGIYGVLSYTVRQRTHELGIRRAVGAGQAQILGLVLGGAARLAGIGLALGLVCALAAGRLMSSMLYGVAPWDPMTLGAVAGGLLVVALVAAFVPAWWAVRVDPLEALR